MAIETVIEVIVKIRDIRRQMDVEPARRVQANLATSDSVLQSVLVEAATYVQNLARCEQVNILPAIGADMITVVANALRVGTHMVAQLKAGRDPGGD